VNEDWCQTIITRAALVGRGAMYPSDIQLSVALVTRNRPDSLERGLISLRIQNIQPFEVIVSDDSGIEHAEATRAVAAKYSCTYYFGPHRGLYANRNFAARQCRGSHIRTMDDDHILPQDHLAKCLEAVRVNPEAIWTTGEIGYLNGKFIGTAKVANQLGPAGVGEPIADPNDNWGIADGSTIYPREIFDRGLRMIEDFDFGSSYLEFGAYLYRHDWKCRCIPGAMVEHHASALSVPDPLSCLFASICFNLYFRPNGRQLGRYLLPQWRNWFKLPRLLEKARSRWKAV
jgi:glycosyltransferase involved in cell wall biosynthesis